MKKILTIVLLLISLFISSPNVAYAHILKTDGTVGAVLHMSPDDDPVAGETTALIFEIKDTSGKFKPDMCMCTVQVLKENEVIKEESVFTKTNASEQSVEIIFPERALYQVQLNGTAHDNSFKSFQLKYDVRVERVATGAPVESPTTTTSRNTAILPIILVPILVLTLLAMISFLKKRAKNNQPPKPPIALILILVIGINLMAWGHLSRVYGEEFGHHQSMFHLTTDHPCCMPLAEVFFAKISSSPIIVSSHIVPPLLTFTFIPEPIAVFRNKSPPAVSFS